MSDFDVDLTGCEHLFREMEDLGGKKAGTIIRESAGLYGRIMAERTVPFMPLGDAPGQKKTGEKTVEKGVASVYVGGSKIYKEIERRIGARAARAWLKLLKTDPNKADALLKQAGIRGSNLNIGAFDGGAAHRAALPTIARRGRNNRPPMIVADVKALNAFRRQQIKRVGWAKSGWITAARQIQGAKGFSKLPAWMRKRGAPGAAKDATRKTSDPYVVLTNRVPYIDKIFRRDRQAQGEEAVDRLIIKSIRAQIAYLKQKNHA